MLSDFVLGLQYALVLTGIVTKDDDDDDHDGPGGAFGTLSGALLIAALATGVALHFKPAALLRKAYNKVLSETRDQMGDRTLPKTKKKPLAHRLFKLLGQLLTAAHVIVALLALLFGVLHLLLLGCDIHVEFELDFKDAGWWGIISMGVLCLSGCLFWTMRPYARFNSTRRKAGKKPLLGLTPKRYHSFLIWIHRILTLGCMVVLIVWHKLV
ncbi:hypothetical protein KIPB_001325 [Kipferlia bialata]|uniref:Uncharacterized protein n=1 Tax=Kipferlia bialata TaxID=797122 RepID=A0A9K3CQJ0_9EUKA|nr:hypothetical protein KIPB_001325 [Kipferlia bialata]|eukprot:g1325.t1